VACLDRERLRCPGCGKTGEAAFVVGVGASSRPGDGPAHATLQDAGSWVIEEKAAHPVFAGRLFCPDRGVEVLNRSETRTT